MKIDRIVGIIDYIQQCGKTTMPFLAEKFNVSRRTICRDIDIICSSGIPIVTSQGADGGIELVKGFFFDTKAFSKDELYDFFAEARTLNNMGDSNSNFFPPKSCTGKNAIPLSDNIMIDISNICKESLAKKILTLKNAIRFNQCVSFRYFTSVGEDDMLVEPYLIIFRRSHWYVFGFCAKNEDFSLYKLNCLWYLELTDQNFVKKELPPTKLHFNEENTDEIKITAIYDSEEKYKLVEQHGPDSFSVTDEGKLRTQWCFEDYDSALSWFMGFGSKVKVLEPEDFKKRYVDEIKRVLKEYDE